MKNVIVDYGMGNLRSIQSKVRMLELDAEISSDPKVLEAAARLILPGVGHFGAGMKNIRDRNLFDVLQEKVKLKKTPVLGICLGMQLLGSRSEEGDANGLAYLDFDVVRFQFNDPKYRIPHVGWNDLKISKKSSILFDEISESTTFYFTHSFYAKTSDQSIIAATTEYGIPFVSVVEKDNVFGTQFHPEKSRKPGLQMLKNFLTRT